MAIGLGSLSEDLEFEDMYDLNHCIEMNWWSPRCRGCKKLFENRCDRIKEPLTDEELMLPQYQVKFKDQL
jgi:hypothetical protein